MKGTKYHVGSRKKTFIIQFISLFSLCLSLPFGIQAQQTVEKYVRETDYLLYLPDEYNEDTSKTWPLMVFLHGSGSVGDDINRVRAGGIPGLIEKGKKFPFIVISPQSSEQGWNTTDLKNLLASEINKYRVDMNRIYLTGLSMGGGGTWDFAVKYPEYFAAIVPICGEPNQAALENVFQLRHTPVWCFHGAEDKIVKPSFSENIIDSLRKYNPEAKLTLYPGVGHDSWTMTYNNDSVYRWLLQQQRHSNRKIDVDESVLKEYSSYKYAIPGQSVVASFTIEAGGLRLWIGDEKGALIMPATKETFFLDANSRKYLIFERDTQGKITGLTLYEYDNKISCKRI